MHALFMNGKPMGGFYWGVKPGVEFRADERSINWCWNAAPLMSHSFDLLTLIRRFFCSNPKCLFQGNVSLFGGGGRRVHFSESFFVLETLSLVS